MSEILYLPVSYLGFKEAPAAISYTDSPGREVDGNYQVRIGLRNHSNKTIKTLKLEWYLFYKDAYQNTQAEDWATFLKKITLSRREISIDDIGEFKSKEDFAPEIKLPCDEIYEKVGSVDVNELIKNENELIIEFVVTELSYDDGSNWQRK